MSERITVHVDPRLIGSTNPRIESKESIHMDEYGPLTMKVIEYQDTVRSLVATVKSPEDWAPLGEFLAIDEFERVGPFLDVQDWPQYAEMVNGWAQGVQSFETTVRRIHELPNRVYFEVEERHLYGQDWLTVNSMSVFEFNEDRKVRHLDVYLQASPPPAG